MASSRYWEHRHHVTQLLKIRGLRTIADAVRFAAIKTSSRTFMEAINGAVVLSVTHFAIIKRGPGSCRVLGRVVSSCVVLGHARTRPSNGRCRSVCRPKERVLSRDKALR